MLVGAQDDAVLTFRNVRGLNPIEKNDFGLERSEDLINRISNISSYLYVAAWIISIITIFGSTINQYVQILETQHHIHQTH